ncbi:MAG: alpha-galactosidase [Clostridiales bacterium]|jgi:alpha-galactosidase|nr:alpha-galactosidase [Clostridiales bacterium]
MARITIQENGLFLVFEINKQKAVKFLHFSSLPFRESLIKEDEKRGFRLVEVQMSGLNRPEERHGTKYIVTAPGYRLTYKSHADIRNKYGRKLEIVTKDTDIGIEVISHFQFFDNIPVTRCWTDVRNMGTETQTLEAVSSFVLNGIAAGGFLPRDERMRVHIPHNSWQRELLWQSYSFEQLGIAQSQNYKAQRSSKSIGVANVGNWSTKEYLPMGVLENTEQGNTLFWQIEHNGSWHWEISDQTNHFYLLLSGPTETESHWFKTLRPGDMFTSVPVCVGATVGFTASIGELTRYRRVIRRANEDNKQLPVIFNDYMNGLFGDPTTSKELPLIDAAAEVGCEYYCIDAGWYADGYWWDNVGEWMPSKVRFPGGLKEVLDYIRSKNMIPGLWLEIEVMGINSPKLSDTDDSWFFTRHGKRVYDRGRFQLDFRSPEVTAFATSVIDRLVNEYGVGYIKMDYNIEPGIGTEQNADSVGEGLLQHERAYLRWLDSIFENYPDLVIENCSSGGLRMDYALLTRHSIQSTSDQEEYPFYATIAANAPTGVTPEQAAVWSYPIVTGDKEEVVFNMVNAMLLRVHQSGHLARISPQSRDLVKEGIAYYKNIRHMIKNALPFWPLGLSRFSDPWVSLGLLEVDTVLLAVWRRDSETDSCVLPIPALKGKTDVAVRCAYPSYEECAWQWNARRGTLSVQLPKRHTARLFEVVAGQSSSI